MPYSRGLFELQTLQSKCQRVRVEVGYWSLDYCHDVCWLQHVSCVYLFVKDNSLSTSAPLSRSLLHSHVSLNCVATLSIVWRNRCAHHRPIAMMTTWGRNVTVGIWPGGVNLKGGTGGDNDDDHNDDNDDQTSCWYIYIYIYYDLITNWWLMYPE